MGIVGKREISLRFFFGITDWLKVHSLALEDTFHTTLLFWVVFFWVGLTDGATLSANVQPLESLCYTFCDKFP